MDSKECGAIDLFRDNPERIGLLGPNDYKQRITNRPAQIVAEAAKKARLKQAPPTVYNTVGGDKSG